MLRSLLQETKGLTNWLCSASEPSLSPHNRSFSPYPLCSHTQVLSENLIQVWTIPLSPHLQPPHSPRLFGLNLILVNVSSRGPPPIEESLLLGSSSFISAPYGDYWKFMKKLMVTKLLGPQAIERSRQIRAYELDRFYKNLLHKPIKKESVEIVEEAMKFTNNSICKMIMGRSCSEDNGEAERVRGLMTESTSLTTNFFLAAILRKPLKMLGISLFKEEIMGVSRRFDEVLETILVEHEEKMEEHHQGTDMMDVLLEAYEDENAEYKITRNHIKSLFVVNSRCQIQDNVSRCQIQDNVWRSNCSQIELKLCGMLRGTIVLRFNGGIEILTVGLGLIQPVLDRVHMKFQI